MATDIERVDMWLRELTQKKLDAAPADKPACLTRIDYWLDIRLEMMKLRDQ